MRRLFEMNARDYDKTGKSQVRHSVRAILLRQGRVAMLFSPKTGAYLFPGGELREGEAPAAGGGGGAGPAPRNPAGFRIRPLPGEKSSG